MIMKIFYSSVSLFVLVLVLVLHFTGGLTSDNVVCYFTNWSYYRTGIAKYSPSDVDGSLCTHIIYSFAVIEENRIKIFDEWLDITNRHLEKVAAVRQKHPKVKVLLAVGGWNAGSLVFSNMAKSPANRKIFIDSVVDVLYQYDYNGLDIDWEYPAKRGGIPADKQNFNTLIKELKAEFNRQARINGGKRMLLTAAVSPVPSTASAAYDKNTVCSELDLVNLMQYDIHGSWEGQTGHNAPLYASAQEATPENVVSATTKDWLDAGCNSEKLILGIPTYGRAWTVTGGTTAVSSPGTPGKPGSLVGQSGILSYQEICNGISEGWQSSYDDSAEQAISFGDGQWVTHENSRSIAAKVSFIKSMKLGGAMIWALDFDDFNGEACGRGNYPLLAEINKNLHGLTQPVQPPNGSRTTKLPSTTTPFSTRAPTTRAPTTRAPATRAPATRVPVTSAPATRAPATRPPTTTPSTTRTPATRPHSIRWPFFRPFIPRTSTTRLPSTRPPAMRMPLGSSPARSSRMCMYRPRCNRLINNYRLPDRCNIHRYFTCTSRGTLYLWSCGPFFIYNPRCKCCALR